MSNYDIIKEFIEGRKDYNAYCHIGYKGNTLTNYSTDMVTIDRDNKIADVNIRKYSRSTTNIQSTIRSLLNRYGYTINEYEGEPCNYWNCGYCGAEHWTVAEVKNW